MANFIAHLRQVETFGILISARDANSDGDALISPLRHPSPELGL